MSYISLESIAYRDDATLDAAGRLRSSSNFPYFDNHNQYGINLRDWVGLNVGTGVQTHVPNEGAIQLSTGGLLAGAACTRQTRLNWRCFPGRSSLVYLSGLIGNWVAGAVKRVGLFDNDDGVFLQVNSTGIAFVKRTSITGVAVDSEVIYQADWEIDKLDGTGPSGETLDLTEYQTIFIDILYTTVGRIRCGFVIHGKTIICHEFHSGDTPLNTVLKTPHLPIRADVTNTGAAASIATLKFRGSCIQIEGGTGELNRGYLNTGTTGNKIACSATRPVISIRAKALLNGLPNRGWVVPYDFSLLASGNDARYDVYVGATLTGASWVSAAADSAGEYDISATAFTGGVRVLSGFLAAGQGQSSSQSATSLIDNYPTSVDSLNGGQTIYTIVITPLAATSDVAASINWREIY